MPEVKNSFWHRSDGRYSLIEGRTMVPGLYFKTYNSTFLNDSAIDDFSWLTKTGTPSSHGVTLHLYHNSSISPAQSINGQSLPYFITFFSGYIVTPTPITMKINVYTSDMVMIWTGDAALSLNRNYPGLRQYIYNATKIAAPLVYNETFVGTTPIAVVYRSRKIQGNFSVSIDPSYLYTVSLQWLFIQEFSSKISRIFPETSRDWYIQNISDGLFLEQIGGVSPLGEWELRKMYIEFW